MEPDESETNENKSEKNASEEADIEASPGSKDQGLGNGFRGCAN
jgi:hypothetical protein